ncbi:hypothetical protein AB1Y20_018999 [Prymnesium parvum]|uniref:Uncharacterized protein n=1 Tax=Prymnesium parvum TaxID=97485 RepID=A0AB34JR22_PRYPA
MNFAEAFGHHVAATMMRAAGVASARLLSKEEFKVYVRGFEPRAVFPQHTILNRIAACIDELQTEKRRESERSLQAQYKKKPHLGLQLDMWTDTTTHTSFACIIATTVAEPTDRWINKKTKPQLYLSSNIISFGRFPHTTKTGENIKSWFVSELSNIPYSTITEITPDGAADGQCALNMIAEVAEKVDTCHLHQLQRGVLYSIGLTGAQCQNVAAKHVLRQHSRSVQLSRQSGAVAKNIRDGQTKEGVPDHKLLATKKPSATRWSGQYLQLQTNCILKPIIQPVIDEYKSKNRNNLEAIVEEHESEQGI